MLSYKLAEKRHSVRDYKKKKLSHGDLTQMRLLGEESPGFIGDTSLEIVFLEEGFEFAPKLEGYAGYYGKMIAAPHYYALVCNPDEVCKKSAGYIGEWLILNALKHDIGSCWLEVIDSVNVKRILNMDTDKEVVALIALGYAKKEFKMSTLYANKGRGSLSTLTDMGYPNMKTEFSKGPTRDHKSITEFVNMTSWGRTPDLNELEKLGIHEALYYMRLAPSHGNRQPWLFFIQESHVDLIVETSEAISDTVQCLDAGIAMFYLEVGLHDSGFKGKWELSETKLDYLLADNQKFAGRYYFDQ